MYCASCGKQLTQHAQFCTACGNSTRSESPAVTDGTRSIAGIAVGAIVGGLGVLWSTAVFWKCLYSNPVGAEAALYNAFPALRSMTFFSSSLGMIGNSVLLIGVLLAFLRHPNADKTVRITSYCMMLAILSTFATTYFAIMESAQWRIIDAPTKDSIIWGLLGGYLGGIFQWALVLFLFRRRGWG